MRYLLVFLLLTNQFIQAQLNLGMGQWGMHVPARRAIDVAIGNGTVLAALESGVVEYDIAASENRVLNRLNALSDILVTCVSYEPSTASFYIGYETGNVDVYKDGNITNIPAIKLAQVGGSKRVNKIYPFNGLVYIATEFSLVIVDPKRMEVRDTYYPTNSTEGINDVLIMSDSIYALSNTRLFRGHVTNQFLSDPVQWSKDPRVKVPTLARYGSLGQLDDQLYVSFLSDAFGQDSIMALTPTGLKSVIGKAFSMQIMNFEINENEFFVYYDNAMVSFNKNEGVNYSIANYGSTAAQPRGVVKDNGFHWVADFSNGLVRYQLNNQFTFIQQEGPPKNSFFSLNGHNGTMLVTGGTLDRVTFQFKLDGAYRLNDGQWSLLDRNNQKKWKDALVWDIATAAVNGVNPNESALACYCVDALSLVNNDSVVEVFNADNSILEKTSLNNGNVCISSMEYDNSGNLWMINCYSNDPLKVRRSDGTWEAIKTGSESAAKYASKLAIDYNGNKWFGVNELGVVGYKEDGTFKVLKAKEGLGNLPSDVVTAIAVDFDNEIWIGTISGFAVLYNSESLFSGGTTDASRILINFEGNVENLLGKTHITDIEIDGGNRKWLATETTGIFLLSANGQEVLQQFTKENSPLISNNIMDMEFNHQTGELYIITDLGMVSLRTDASYEDPEYENVNVFPNPVKPDFFGPITIQGIRFDSDVKVTDASGNLIYATVSNGGTATWNGKTTDGQPVASGVYFIWTATNGSKNKKVAKVAVIR